MNGEHVARNSAWKDEGAFMTKTTMMAKQTRQMDHCTQHHSHDRLLRTITSEEVWVKLSSSYTYNLHEPGQEQKHNGTLMPIDGCQRVGRRSVFSLDQSGYLVKSYSSSSRNLHRWLREVKYNEWWARSKEFGMKGRRRIYDKNHHDGETNTPNGPLRSASFAR